MAQTSSQAISAAGWLANFNRARQLRLPWIPVVIMGVLIICAIFAPLLAPHDPSQIDLLNSRIAPGEDWSYPLGTDIMGRDMLSRLIFGAQTAAKISFLALAVGMVVGTVLGLWAGYKGRL